MGLPQETRETAEETIKFSLECGCDYASFNIAVPRMGTVLRKNVVGDGLIDSGLDEMDQSGSRAVFSTKGLTIREVEEFKNKALMSFYLRPSYILGELTKIRSMRDLTSHVDGLLGVLKNMR